MKKLLIAALLLSSCLGSPAFADQVVKPATGSNFNTCTTLISTTDITCVQLKTAAGTTIDPATSGNQATANTSLSTIATNTTGVATAANQVNSIFYNGATGSGSALTGSATFTGVARDVGVASGSLHQFAYFNTFFLTDQAGTARIDCSNDNITWYTCATQPLVAASPMILTVPVMTRYHRAVVVNGATAETFLWVNSSYTEA
jgi:hypothetical protein